MLFRPNNLPFVLFRGRCKTIFKRGMAQDCAKTKCEREVVFDIKNKVGFITLNKPKQLNALNLCMVTQIVDKLAEWEKNGVPFIIIRGNGKAFCAGGDVVSVTKGGPKNACDGKLFFRKEYTMNYRLGTFSRPIISFLDGITMGGGVGLSVHGKYRIATENTLFAMPETAIGLFPDVGGSYVLPRLKGCLGTYLALTGGRLKGMDVAKAGIATHYMPSKGISNLINELVNNITDACQLEEAIQNASQDISCYNFSLESKMDLINKSFKFQTMEEIIASLEECGCGWSQETIQILKPMSPTSLKISLKELVKGKDLSFKECLQMEFRLATAALEGRISKDFYEGVRALLIDKDKNPKWSPAKLEDITDEMLEKCFTPLHEFEELCL